MFLYPVQYQGQCQNRFVVIARGRHAFYHIHMVTEKLFLLKSESIEIKPKLVSFDIIFHIVYDYRLMITSLNEQSWEYSEKQMSS